MQKNNEISLLQKEQKDLKKEIIEIKKKLPRYVIGFILFTVISLYFLEDKFHSHFGNAVNLILTGLIFFGCVCLFFIYKSYNRIEKKKKESKLLGTKLYNLMKLGDDAIL
jgi:cytochrome bd-type quinol oxidase subunit 2